jgi:hypothetical protein
MRALCVLGVAASALLLLALVTAAALIGLNAECNGAGCPRSDGYRFGIIAAPVVTFVLLVAGTAWSILRRRVWPLVLAEAASVAVVALLDAGLSSFDLGTVVLLAIAALVGRAAARTAS